MEAPARRSHDALDFCTQKSPSDIELFPSRKLSASSHQPAGRRFHGHYVLSVVPPLSGECRGATEAEMVVNISRKVVSTKSPSRQLARRGGELCPPEATCTFGLHRRCTPNKDSARESLSDGGLGQRAFSLAIHAFLYVILQSPTLNSSNFETFLILLHP